VQVDDQDLEDTYMIPSQCVIFGSVEFRDFSFYHFHSEWTLKRVFDEWNDSVKLIPCPAIITSAPKVVNGFSFRWSVDDSWGLFFMREIMSDFVNYKSELDESDFFIGNDKTLFLVVDGLEEELILLLYCSRNRRWKKNRVFEYWRDVVIYLISLDLDITFTPEFMVDAFVKDVCVMFEKSDYSADEAEKFLEETEYVKGGGTMPVDAGLVDRMKYFKYFMSEAELITKRCGLKSEHIESVIDGFISNNWIFGKGVCMENFIEIILARNFETAVAAPLHGARGIKVPAGRSPAL
jgi:hypothetical protein